MDAMRRRLFGWLIVALLGAALPLSGWAHGAHRASTPILAPDGGLADICGAADQPHDGSAAADPPCLACQLGKSITASPAVWRCDQPRRAREQTRRSRGALPPGRVLAAARPRGPPPIA
ncbi:hypothetical protein [Rubrimonas cliftonensis]|uniref:hypothetical protein n=1 Tax=Rubrimonas cliftonensis TaxID=89524 RepID=UPI0011147122|nr:hypothetical protein [Rubrimonas cliftonensis]